MPKPPSADYTRKVYAIAEFHFLELLIKPDTDLDSTFKAWDIENAEWLSVNGWLFHFEDDEGRNAA